MRSKPDRLFEQQFWQQHSSLVAGVDEVGVGAWAGPVVAAAVILPRDFLLEGLNDSKLLSARRRSALFDSIRECAVSVGVGQVEVADIDQLNIYWAAMLAPYRTSYLRTDQNRAARLPGCRGDSEIVCAGAQAGVGLVNARDLCATKLRAGPGRPSRLV